MSTYQSEFIELAEELLVEFDDFASDVVVTTSMSFQYKTQSSNPGGSTFRGIRYEDNEDNSMTSEQGRKSSRKTLLITSYARMGESIFSTLEPNNTQLTMDGIKWKLIDIDKLPGKTAVIMQIERN